MIPTGSHADVSLMLPDMAALVLTGLVAALTRCHTFQCSRRGAEGWGWGCWQQVTALEVGGRTLPMLLTSQHCYRGLRHSKTPQGASLVPSCVPCPRAVCSKTRLDFLAFCWSVLSGVTQEAPASLRTITAPDSGRLPRAAWPELAPAPCASRGPTVPCHRGGTEERTEAALDAGT